MFTRLNPQGVGSSSGFAVQVTGRGELEYIEDDHVLRVEFEPGINKEGQYDIAVYRNSIKTWLPPFQREMVSKEKREQVAKRIGEALAFLGTPYSIV